MTQFSSCSVDIGGADPRGRVVRPQGAFLPTSEPPSPKVSRFVSSLGICWLDSQRLCHLFGCHTDAEKSCRRLNFTNVALPLRLKFHRVLRTYHRTFGSWFRRLVPTHALKANRSRAAPVHAPRQIVAMTVSNAPGTAKRPALITPANVPATMNTQGIRGTVRTAPRTAAVIQAILW